MPVELLQRAVDQAFNAVITTTADLGGDGPTITYCNQAFCAMTGYTEAEILGRSPKMLQGPLTDQNVLQSLRECLRKGTFFQGSTFNYRKDGSAYMVEWTISPVRDAAGEVRHFVSVQQDVTQRVQAERAQVLLGKAMNAVDDAMLITDAAGQILFANHAFKRLIGYTYEEIRSLAPSFETATDHAPKCYDQLRTTALSGSGYRKTFANRHKNGRRYYLEQVVTPLTNEHGAVVNYVCMIKNVTATVKREQQLQEEARRDELTALLNRRGGIEALRQCHRQAQEDGSSYAIILCDIDHFKRINDHYGHQSGDLVLQHCAQQLLDGVRQGDIAVRWGGEEFLIILPHCELSAAVARAETLRQGIAAQTHLHIGQVYMSMGVAALLPDETPSALLRRADMALYVAKANGRNRVCPATGADSQTALPTPDQHV